jgi:uncharacterized protein (TIGR00369 family)
MSREPHVPAVAGVDPESVSAFVRQQWPDAPFAVCHEISGRHVLTSMPISPANLRPGGIISGPMQFTAADLTLWYACFGAIDFEAMAVTSEMSIRFLRPAFGDVLWSRAELVSVGSRSIVGSVIIWTDDEAKPTSVAQGTYSRPAASPPAVSPSAGS